MRTLILILCMCFGVQGMKGISNITLGSLPAKERNRRLIPYMTYYLGHPQNTQYRQVMTVPYVAVPQFRPSQQRYVQQSTPLTRMIAQNYLALQKQPQGSPRLVARINPNIHPNMKYYVTIANHQPNIAQIAPVQYSKPQNIIQYVKTQAQEQYSKQADTDYDQRVQEPQDHLQYPKPAPDALLQYIKPEVQQYVSKYSRPNIQYTKQEQDDYEDIAPQSPPIQYVTKQADGQAYVVRPELQYAKNVEPIQYTTKPVEPTYIQKPLIRYSPKVAIANLAPLPADIPEYINRPVQKSPLKPTKNEQTSVTITQSQELDVDALSSTPAPAVPKYHATYVAKPESYLTYEPEYQRDQEDVQEEDLDPETIDKNLNNLLDGVSLSKSLPERITSENLDSSIRTLSKILRILQRANALPQSAKEVVRGFPKQTSLSRPKSPDIKLPPKSKFNDGSTPGRPGVDYPNYDEIPQTQFSCKEQRYKGFFGDPETGCQVWHYCDLNGGQASFLCPNGTIFSQVALTCDWWFNVKCASTAQLYVLNERLYKYILPQKPSFPEDYSGPLVDHYLSLKFKEIEEKNKNKTETQKDESKEDEDEPSFSIDTVAQNKVRSLG